MSNVDTLLNDLVIANRILANEDVVDAYGHVSVRNPDKPDRFFLARSLAPEFITREDIIEFTLDGKPVGDEKRAPYLERFIHGGIFEARPDVMAVVHAHAEDILPFGLTTATPLKPVIHSGSFIAAQRPRASEGKAIRRADQISVAGRDRLAQPRLQPLFGRDLARLALLGNQGGRRRHGHASGREIGQTA